MLVLYQKEEIFARGFGEFWQNFSRSLACQRRGFSVVSRCRRNKRIVESRFCLSAFGLFLALFILFCRFLFCILSSFGIVFAIVFFLFTICCCNIHILYGIMVAQRKTTRRRFIPVEGNREGQFAVTWKRIPVTRDNCCQAPRKVPAARRKEGIS